MANDARADRLARAVANLRGGAVAAPLDLTPKSAHEALTRQMVTDLGGDLDEVKKRVDATLWLVAGAVVVEIVMRLVGVGS